MQITISGQHISIGHSLSKYAEDRTSQVVKKYFAAAISTNVHFSKHGLQFVCDIVVNDGTGRHIILKSSSSSEDIYSTFDNSLARLEKQLRKYKSKLNDRHDIVKASQTKFEATKYVITPNNSSHDEEMPQDDSPIIIAEKAVEVLSLSVSEAVMKMDLENLPALMFQNIQTDRTNIVYYRKDGNISWIDSK